MNKKFIGLFILFLVALLAIGSVGAADLKNHDFDGYFSMKVPKGVSFQKQNDSISENGLKQISLTYVSNDLYVGYIESPMFSDNSSVGFFQSTFEAMYPDLDKCYETQEGNLLIFEPKNIDETHFPLVATSSGNKIVFIVANDLELAEEAAQSVKFN